jgi:hypothetical protein
MRTRPDHGVVRGVRAAVLTLPAVGAAAAAHLLVDGCADLVGSAVALGVVWPAAVALLGRRRSVPAFLLWVVAAQAVTHILLELTCRSVTSGETPFLQHVGASPSARMLAAHGVAALLTAVALGRADAGLWTAHALLRLVGRLRVPALTVVLPLRPLPAVPAPATQLRDRLHHRLPGRRGPPALCAR